jgi:hypothetical protein
VPFLRYARDRRGYETTFLMHGYRPAQGTGQTRVLYLFRSPAHVKVGRRALDDEAREALEHTHPDLSFDWAALGREPAPHHFEERDRQVRAGRGRGAQRTQPARTAPPPAVAEDASVLGRALGTAAAARLRERYGELVRRIARRAPTPEERDRLTERAQRLNPDDWVDEAAVRAGAQTVEAAWDAIRRELPSRRWGSRRGDRRPLAAGAPSEPGPDQSPAAAGAAGEASAIIERRSGEANAREDDRQVAGPDSGASAPGDGDPVGGGSGAPAGDRFPGGE